MVEKTQALTPEEINQQRDEERRDTGGTLLLYAVATKPVDTVRTSVRVDASTTKADVVPVAPLQRSR